jgi:hypothetical protein
VLSQIGVEFDSKQAAGTRVHKELENRIRAYKPIAGIEVIPEVFFHEDGTETSRRDKGTLGIDILIKRNGTNVLGIDLEIGAGFPAAKRRAISSRAGNIPIVQVFIGVRGK